MGTYPKGKDVIQLVKTIGMVPVFIQTVNLSIDLLSSRRLAYR